MALPAEKLQFTLTIQVYLIQKLGMSTTFYPIPTSSLYPPFQETFRRVIFKIRYDNDFQIIFGLFGDAFL
jgi:hypothetical protein